jgi:hypothetical protein
MLELEPGSDLATWRVPHWPPEANDHFTPLPHHRRHYLEYEGPVSDNRGEVRRVACGLHTLLENSPTRIVTCLTDGQQIKLPRI